MLGSLLLALTVSAVVLLTPAYVSLLRVGRHAHVAARDESSRAARLLVAAGFTGVGGFAVAALLVAHPVTASATAVVLAGSVLVSGRLSKPSWTVRGVVVRALLVVASAGLATWLLDRLLTSHLSRSELVVGGTAWLLMVLGMLRVRGNANDRVASLSRRVTAASEVHEDRARRPLVALGALVAAGVAVSVTALGGPTVNRPASVVRETGSPDRSSLPTQSARSTTPAATSSTTGAQPADPSASDRAVGGGTSGGTAGGATTALPTTEVPGPTERPTSGTAKDRKTPGYEKQKPNRPTDAPTPGEGRTKLP